MSDEVSSFLRSVEQLKDRRDEEDEARSRELEEKILQERRERQARRAGTLRIASCACVREATLPIASTSRVCTPGKATIAMHTTSNQAG